MTAALDRPVMSNGHLFESPKGLYPFQVDAVMALWTDPEGLVGAIDIGLGKTVIMIAAAANMIEAGDIDQVIVIARKSKLGKTEFPKDFADFSSLSCHLHWGPNRWKKLEYLPRPPEVWMMTYETARNELTKVEKTAKAKSRGTRLRGRLYAELGLDTRRTLWVFDEIIKLGNRGSETYKSIHWAIEQNRRHASAKVLGLHANSMATDYDQAFNIGRLVCPSRMPTVSEFEDRYTYGHDEYGRYSFRKEARTEFAARFQQITFRKLATDDDVASQYPKMVEDIVAVDLAPEHRALYGAVADLYGDDWDELTDEQLTTVRLALRLTLGHPAAHLHSTNELSRAIVDTLGEPFLREVPSSKTLRLVEMLKEVADAGERAIVFTFFAQTVLPEVYADLNEHGLRVATYHGGHTPTQNEAAKALFKAHDVDVLLSSDAGNMGLNLPEASHIIEYESSHTYDQRSQRFGRATRIGSTQPFIYARTLACRGTLDRAQIHKVLRRNDWQDTLLGDVGRAGHKAAATRKSQLLSGVSL